jgi:propane monooxygenase reductase subunit
MARVSFVPIDEEIECGSDQAILDAAFADGLSLAHGCREGQCSACKAFLLEGEVTLMRHSSFALSESEQDQGYTLLCRAMPDSDVVVELLHVDEDYRLANPIVRGRARVSAIESLTHDIRRLVLEVIEPAGFAFTPGQYVDLFVPTGAGGRRAFSMANLPGDGALELIIKRYEGGRFSSLLDGGLAPGDELDFAGPYGALRLSRSARAALLVAGGSGLGPIISLLREMVAAEYDGPVRFFYGVRARGDLFWLREVEEVGGRLPDFRFVPVLSEESWEGECGYVHEAVERLLDIDDYAAYLCGPPPMIDAMTELLVDGRGLPKERLFYDSFTQAADAAVIEEEETA